jgi:Icc-related predicted phosphoesterase
MKRNSFSCAAAAALLILLLCLAGAGCGKNTAPSSTPRSTPASTSVEGGAHFKFIVCGDPQNNYEVFDRVLAAAKNVDFLLIAGDLTGSGTSTEFQSFLNVIRASGVKYFCVPGNHDVATSPVNVNYQTYIGAPHQSFDYGNSHFLLIDNSTPSLGFYPAEQQWAAADLQAARKKGLEHSFAVAHVPPGWPYSARADRSQITGIDNNRQLVQVLKAGGVENLFCGHVHTYSQEEDDGVTITITGGAGAPLMGADSYHNYVLVEVDGQHVTQNVVRI